MADMRVYSSSDILSRQGQQCRDINVEMLLVNNYNIISQEEGDDEDSRDDR